MVLTENENRDHEWRCMRRPSASLRLLFSEIDEWQNAKMKRAIRGPTKKCVAKRVFEITTHFSGHRSPPPAGTSDSISILRFYFILLPGFARDFIAALAMPSVSAPAMASATPLNVTRPLPPPPRTTHSPNGRVPTAYFTL
ncbi:MAG: hypothetical protein SPI19_04910 [Peptoniphilaceae bacterium]|nr:hypothetical protein [Peptoniphilaceae bacterium]